MQFNLCNGKATQTTTRFAQRTYLTQIMEIFRVGEHSQPDLNDYNFKKVMQLIQDCRFSADLDSFSDQDKRDLLQTAKVHMVRPGHRFHQNTNQIDSFCLIMKGKVGILYPDQVAIKEASLYYNRLVTCNQQQAEERQKSKAYKPNKQSLDGRRVSQMGKKRELSNKPISSRLEQHQQQTQAAISTLNTFNNFLSYGNTRKLENPLMNLAVDDILKVDSGDNTKSHNKGKSLMLSRLKLDRGNRTPMRQPSIMTNQFMQQTMEMKRGSLQLSPMSKGTNVGDRSPFSKNDISPLIKTPLQSNFGRQTSQQPDVLSEEKQDIDNKSNANDDFAPQVTMTQDLREVLSFETAPILRDSAQNYKPLERQFGTLTQGMAFGETALLDFQNTSLKFFNAVALTECWYLEINRDDYERIYKAQDKRHLTAKSAFIRIIPEFNNYGFSKQKEKYICQNLQPITRQRGHVIFQEGDLTKFVYFIRKGEVQVFKKIKIQHAKDNEDAAVHALLEDPTNGRKKHNNRDTGSYEVKHHLVYMAQKGAILGLEDVVLGNTDLYQTTSIVHSQDGVELYRIDKDQFANPLRSTPVWPSLVTKATHQIYQIKGSLRNMLKTNKKISDNMKNNIDSGEISISPKKERKRPSKIHQIIEDIEMAGAVDDYENYAQRSKLKSQDEVVLAQNIQNIVPPVPNHPPSPSFPKIQGLDKIHNASSKQLLTDYQETRRLDLSQLNIATDSIFENTNQSFNPTPFLSKLKNDRMSERLSQARMNSSRRLFGERRHSPPTFIETNDHWKHATSKLGPIPTKSNFTLRDDPRKMYNQAVLFKNSHSSLTHHDSQAMSVMMRGPKNRELSDFA